MSINQKRRILSETITSVDDPIEWTQKGEVVMTKSASTTTFVPTTIAKPKTVNLLSHMANFTRQNASALVPYAELNTALTPESGMKLYTAASAKAGGAYLTSAQVTNCKLGQLFIDSTEYKLYRLKTASSSTATIGAVLASATLKSTFLENVPFTDTAKFIKMFDITAATTIAFSFEVKGY